MPSILAIYEDGVFKPVTTVDLPERCEVEVRIAGDKEVPESARDAPNQSPTGMDKIYELLDERFQSGHSDTASRTTSSESLR